MEGWVGAADTQGSLSAQLAPHPPLLTLQDRSLPLVCLQLLSEASTTFCFSDVPVRQGVPCGARREAIVAWKSEILAAAF